jgi:ribosomal protein L21E
MNLVSMKVPKKSKDKLQKERMPELYDEERWPYGLQLHFSTEQVALLPSLKNYNIGDRVIITAEASVIEVRQTESQSTSGKNEKTEYTIEFQVEQVAVDPKIVKPVEKMSPKEYRNMREK